MEREFYPNACIICDATTSLKRCSRCEMVSYCSTIHQEKHWPVHKDLCKIISAMMKEKGVTHLFEKLRGTDLQSWRKERIRMKYEAELRLRRNFLLNDANLFNYPRSCFVCHESRQTLLNSCPGCPGASFCKEHPNSPIHDEDCAIIRETFESTIRFNKLDQIHIQLSIGFTLFGTMIHKSTEHPASMKEFILKFTKFKNSPLKRSKEIEIFISELFSTTLTTYNALQKVELSHASKLTIHVQSIIECTFSWEILFHLLPYLKVLDIMIVDSCNALGEKKEQEKLCPTCTLKGKKMSYDYLKVSYEAHMRGNYQEPDMLVYSDITVPGKEDFFEENARNLLKMWSRLNCPVIVTTVTEGDHKLLKKSVKSILGNMKVFFEGDNPFKSLFYRRNHDDGRLGLSDHYMIILKSNRFLRQKIPAEISSISKARKISTRVSNLFYASVCHVCGSSNVSVTCKRCKMIFYCGKRHQEENQVQHKVLCKTILRMLNESEAPNLFDKLKTEDSELWLRAKLHLMSKARSKLGRELMDYEKQMFLFPKTCFICHESDLSVLKNCECGVNLCKIHKNAQEHKTLCSDLSLAFKLSINERPEIPKTIVRKLNQDGHKTVPISMAACIDSFLKFEKMISNSDIPNLEKILISDFLTRPFTFLWCLEKLNYKNKSSLVLHVIGATNSEVSAQKYWKMVLYRFVVLKTLKIIFIGPEISNTSSMESGLEFPSSSLVGKNLQVESHALKYEEYFQSKSFIQPNIIIGFNLHLHESELEIVNNNFTWKETVLSLKKIDAPFILTAGSEIRAQKDHERLCHLLGKTVEFHCCEKNPFAGLIPERDFETEKLLFSNQYVIIYKNLYEGKLLKSNRLKKRHKIRIFH